MEEVITKVNSKSSMLEILEASALLEQKDALSDLRCEGFKHFQFLGFPTVKNEEWKYTNILPAVSKPMSPARQTQFNSRLPFLKKDALVITLVNGFPVNLPAAVHGIEIRNISEASVDEAFTQRIGKYADHHIDALAALNTAFINQGLYIKVKKNSVIEKPVYIINYSDSGIDDVSVHPRCLIVSEEGSKAVIEWITVSSGAPGSVFVNAVNEIVVEQHAKLDFCILQNDNDDVSQVCNTYVHQDASSHFNINTITTGGNLVRNKLHIMLAGKHVETHLFGLYMGDDNQHIDNHTAVFHSMPNCFSNQRYKGILDGNSQGVFNGKIFVMQDAQKTNAYQSNKNILLSDGASMFAKPQLEIFADDVKCSHGATTGQLDREALFYLRSRGIGEGAAKALLNVAFAADVIQNIPNEDLRNYIMELIHSKLIKD